MALTPPQMPPAGPRMRTSPLPTHDGRDVLFLERAFSRPAPNAAHPLLWAAYDDFNDEPPPTPMTPRLRCIPLPPVEDPVLPSTSRRANTFYPATPTPHRSLQSGLLYDLCHDPSTAVLLLQTPSALGLILGPAMPPAIALPFPFTEPATTPPLPHMRIQAGTHHHDILIVAGPSGIVTCGDVLAQLYDYLQAPLRDWEDRELDTRRLLEAHRRRVRAKGDQDAVRNVDALLGLTQFWALSPANPGGSRWVLHTTGPGA